MELNGFGRNFEKLNLPVFPADVFGDFMSQEYERKLATSAVFIILQNMAMRDFAILEIYIPFAIPGSKFLYIGPPCDISETLNETGRGVHVSRSDSREEIVKSRIPFR